MPTTRAARAAARAAARCLTEVLPADALGLVLYQLPLAHDIAAVAPTCHALCDAAKLARKLRPFSPEVVMLNGVGGSIRDVEPSADGLIFVPSHDGVNVWSGNACVRSIQLDRGVDRLAMLNGVLVNTCRNGQHLRAVTLDGAHKRTIAVAAANEWFVFNCIAALPDGVHFAVGLGRHANNEVRLYHVDGTLVHTFKGHTGAVYAVAVTPDGQHIISGSQDKLVKVWNVASKSLVTTCAGHNQAIWSVAVMPDGHRILSGACYRNPGTGLVAPIRMHRLDGTLVRTFLHHEGTATAMDLAPLPDNTHVLSASRDFTVKLFNVNDGAVLRTFNAAEPSMRNRAFMCLALLPDGLRFVSGAEDGTARIFYHGLAPA